MALCFGCDCSLEDRDYHFLYPTIKNRLRYQALYGWSGNATNHPFSVQEQHQSRGPFKVKLVSWIVSVCFCEQCAAMNIESEAEGSTYKRISKYRAKHLSCPKRHCLVCNRGLWGEYPYDGHVCSDVCRLKSYYKYSPVNNLPIPCAHCGVEFKPKRKDARFHAGKCRQAAYRKTTTAEI